MKKFAVTAVVLCALSVFSFVAVKTFKRASVQSKLTAFAPVGAPSRVYPYSVVAGGVPSAEAAVLATKDPVVQQHYSGISLNTLQQATVRVDTLKYVSYRIRDQVYWTSKRIRIKSGEPILTNQDHAIRARCGNLLSDVPMTPTNPHEPGELEFDNPVPVAPGRSDAVATTAANPGIPPAGSAGAGGISGPQSPLPAAPPSGTDAAAVATSYDLTPIGTPIAPPGFKTPDQPPGAVSLPIIDGFILSLQPIPPNGVLPPTYGPGIYVPDLYVPPFYPPEFNMPDIYVFQPPGISLPGWFPPPSGPSNPWPVTIPPIPGPSVPILLETPPTVETPEAHYDPLAFFTLMALLAFRRKRIRDRERLLRAEGGFRGRT